MGALRSAVFWQRRQRAGRPSVSLLTPWPRKETTLAYFTPTGIECTYSDAYSGGKLKPGYKDILGNGESVGFMGFVDRAPGKIMFTDSRPADRSGIEAARRAWLDGKANQYRQPSAQPQTEHRTADARTGLRDAKAARLARLSTAYRSDR
jgi:hypothetical protein